MKGVIEYARQVSEDAEDMVQIVTKELQRAMSITGCKNLKDIDEAILYCRSFQF